MFVEWLFTPQDQREHKTRTGWGEAHGVSRQTLWEWREDDEVLALIKEWRRLTEAHWPTVAATLVSVATDRDHPNVVQGIRTLAELLEKFPDKRIKVDHTVSVTRLYAAAAAALDPGVSDGEFTEEPETEPASQ